jgi:hypothetical protein
MLLDEQSSFAATRNRVKNIFEIHFSTPTLQATLCPDAHISSHPSSGKKRERTTRLFVASARRHSPTS